MTLLEIIDVTRNDFLYDSNSILWSDTLLELYGNEAVREACRRAHLIVDNSTADDSEASPLPLCQLTLVGGTATYTLSQKIIRILKCVPSYNSIQLHQKTEDDLDALMPSWRTATGQPRYFVQDKGKITLVPEPEANDTQSVSSITRAGTTATVIHSVHGYDDGATVTHAGADQAEYNVTAVITKIDANSYSYTVTGAPDSPATGTLTAILKDTIALTVSRLPLANMSIGGGESPEIPEEYHLHLIDWICHLALMKHDQEAENIKKAFLHGAKFEKAFGVRESALVEANRRRSVRNPTARPRRSGL